MQTLSWAGLKAWQKVLLLLVAGYVVLGLLVWWVVSPLVRQPVINAVGDATGRVVEMESLSLNPLNWSLRIKGFNMLDADGESFVAFDEFYINFQLSSLFRRSWHFDSIQLHHPRGRVVQLAEGVFNFDDLMSLGENAPDPAPESTAVASIPSVSFREFVLSEGDFRFLDVSRAEPHELVLSPLSFEIRDFSTRSDGEGSNFYEFKVEGPAGGRLEWAGSVAVEPLVLQGEMALSQVDITPFAEFVQDQLNFSLSSALLDIRGRYRFEQARDNLFELQDGELRLSQVRIHERDETTSPAVVSLPTLQVSGVALSTATFRVDVQQVLVDGLSALLVQEASGTNLERLFTPLAPENPEPLTVQTETAEVDIPTGVSDAVDLAEERINERVEQGWYAVVQEVTVQNATLSLLDKTLAGTDNRIEPHLVLQPVNATVRDFDSRGESSFGFVASAVLASGGEFAVTGSGQLSPLAVTADSTLSDIGLSLANPWLANQMNASLQNGVLNGALKTDVQQQDDQVTVLLGGNTEITDFNFQETGADNASVMSFQRLALEGWSLNANTQAFDADRILLAGLKAVMSVDANGRDLMTRLQKAPETAAEPAASASAGGNTATPPLNIREVVLQGAALSYVDHSLEPDFHISLDDFGGTVTGLSSQQKTPAKVDFKGLVDRLSPLTLQGEAGFFDTNPDVNLKLGLAGYEMTRLSPYTGTFLGFAVNSGQLSVGSTVRIRDQHLDSSSDIKADQFYLGDEVASEEAIKVPIKLGLAILRDRNGLIALPVNASGDLNDPSVSVSGIILRTLRNILVRAATSPFSLIGGLMAGEGQQQILFEEGGANLAEGAVQTLDALAKALLDRPSLLLNLTGSTAEPDQQKLAEADLLKQLEVAQGTSRDEALQQGSVQRALNRLYEKQLGADVDALLDATIEDKALRQWRQSQQAFAALQQKMATDMPEQRLHDLAERRAQEVKRYLVEQQQVPGERIFITGSAPKARVTAVELELGAR